MSLIKLPSSITFDEVFKKKSFSSVNYEKFIISNKNKIQLKSLVNNIKNGKEVGSNAYIPKSNKFFLRTKALQEDYVLLKIDSESSIPIKPVSFKDINLSKGEILISKDSNIGEMVYIYEDMPDFSICAGIKAISIPKNKFYVMAFLKNNFFKKQIESLISKGSIMSHAKEKFLDCFIPFPDKNEIIEYVSILMQSWLEKEKTIQEKYNSINKILEEEILNNQDKKNFIFKNVNLKEAKENERLDAGVYNEDYKRIIFLIENYTGGSFRLSQDKFKGGSTPKSRVFGRGNKNWITPSNISDEGYVNKNEKIICDKTNIYKDCVIIGNRTSRGGMGEYVGISFFYDYNKKGGGHHNQGCYRIENLPREDLIMIALLMNSNYYRKLCGYISLGSKMKEIKIKNLTRIPFINIKKEIKKRLIDLYSKEPNVNINDLDLNSFKKRDNLIIKDSGILRLANDIRLIRDKLDKIVESISDNKKIEIDFNFLK